MRTCDHCGSPLARRQQRWCSTRCRVAHSNTARRTRYLPDRRPQTACLQCDGPIPNPDLRRVYCGLQCADRMRRRRQRGDPTAKRAHYGITDQHVTEAKARWPSCTRPWTADMIDHAVRKDMLLLIARKIERLDQPRS